MYGRLPIFVAMMLGGCHSLQTEPVAVSPTTMGTPNPEGPAFLAPGQLAANDPSAAKTIVIPVTNEDYAWELIVDVVDDYFDVDQENRVQVVGNVVTEGRIETFPQVGATVLEPNRFDSVGRYNLAESTFQSVRRRGEVRVVPQQGGWLVDVVVYKEFEDLSRPENANTGAATFRFDNSIPSRLDEGVSRTKLSKFWIPMGRDCEIETQILLDIQDRIANPPQ
ncbi:MAG: hypothetical protein SH868_06225 [Bythopirellula sp.]|nr:hypothetical protein [Bythopirellula sp.]